MTAHYSTIQRIPLPDDMWQLLVANKRINLEQLDDVKELEGPARETRLQEIAKANVEAFNARAKDEKLQINPNHSSLAGFDLSHIAEIDLSGTVLPGINLQSISAPGINLEHSDLIAANMSWAEIPGANLQYSRLSGTRVLAEVQANEASNILSQLHYAILTNANLSGAEMQWISAEGADFSNATAIGTDFFDAELGRANFSGTDLNEAKFQRAHIEALIVNEETNMRGVELTYVQGLETDTLHSWLTNNSDIGLLVDTEESRVRADILEPLIDLWQGENHSFLDELKERFNIEPPTSPDGIPYLDGIMVQILKMYTMGEIMKVQTETSSDWGLNQWQSEKLEAPGNEGTPRQWAAYMEGQTDQKHLDTG